MSVLDNQKNILEAIKVIASQEAKKNSGPTVKVGVVAEDPQGYKCIVNIQGTEKTCTLPEHLHDWISKDDIVYVTDINGNNSEWVVTGSSGSTRGQTLVVNDEDKGKLTGGVTKMEDPDGNLTDNSLKIS